MYTYRFINIGFFRMLHTRSYTYSQYVVKYYGSYFKNTDLWIVMEYCGAGSVSDIMRIINRPVS